MSGYTVIDTETTGLSTQHDRIVELGIVYVSESGKLQGEWETLVNPQRDVGPTRVHGITARDVLDAPTFEQVAPFFVQAVAGRTMVAHNARFDLRLLAAELKRAGVPISVDVLPGLDTMRWAPYFLSSDSRRLGDCCSAAGIDLSHAHSALGDAHATGELLASFIPLGAQLPDWKEQVAKSSCFDWPQFSGAFPQISMVSRPKSTPRQPATWLSRLTARLPRVDDNAADAYFEVLSRALWDGQLSLHEQNQLVALADELGLSAEQAQELHAQYVHELWQVARSDGIITADEQATLESVANCLGLDAATLTQTLQEQPELTDYPRATTELILQPGDRVVFTGDTACARTNWIERVTRAGLTTGAVTKRTRVLVAADPDSQSGKANTARRYGIPIITEAAFERLLAKYEQTRRPV